RMSSIYEIKMLTMIILYTECLIQRTKLGYDSTPFNHKDTPTAEIYTLSLHDALPILGGDATHLTAEGAVAHCDENTIGVVAILRSEEHTSELQSQSNLVCRLLQEKKKPQIRAENVHTEKSVHVVLNPTYKAGLRRDDV